MPKNTGAGLIISAIATLLGFALVWHIWWLAGVSLVAMIAASIKHTFNYKRDYHIPAETVIKTEHERTQLLAGEAA